MQARSATSSIESTHSFVPAVSPAPVPASSNHTTIQTSVEEPLSQHQPPSPTIVVTSSTSPANTLKSRSDNSYTSNTVVVLSSVPRPNGSNVIVSELTPLQQAVLDNNNALLASLCSAGADVNAVYNGETAVHMTARKNAVECIQVLASNGADLDALTPEGYGMLCDI